MKNSGCNSVGQSGTMSLSFAMHDQRTQRTLPETQRGAIADESEVQINRLDNVIDQPCAIGGGNGSGAKMDVLPEIMQKWAMGQLTNFDYLMILNRLANRQMGNPNHHSHHAVGHGFHSTRWQL